ncbi:NAD-dependent epimerase/dehydratase family protein [Cellulomonas sp. ATA003]|uniref:NAD-dependent epimerase/dehydratase family protein n=1 Tax=Cellulomonas sp. ATA003 TaxID=3073064 RepID=UPI0037C0261E
MGRVRHRPAGEDAPVLERLTEAFAGADAVIHLAWLIQPNHDRAALRRTNVDGTRRVIEAVRRAGVPHLVVASSVGAYSPVTDDAPRDESWPTEGIRSSEYSVDKAAVERLLDEAEVLQPDLVVTRMRPALIFQKHAGAQIQRYFLGRLFPARMLGEELPALPWPAGLRLQAVHADDVAAAYREAVVRRMGVRSTSPATASCTVRTSPTCWRAGTCRRSPRRPHAPRSRRRGMRVSSRSARDGSTWRWACRCSTRRVPGRLWGGPRRSRAPVRSARSSTASPRRTAAAARRCARAGADRSGQAGQRRARTGASAARSAAPPPPRTTGTPAWAVRRCAPRASGSGCGTPAASVCSVGVSSRIATTRMRSG